MCIVPTSIIVPLDGSERAEAALAPAAALARGFGVPLVLVQAVDAGEMGAAQTYLDEVAGRIGGDVSSIVVPGPAETEILEVLSEHPSAVACMTTRGHTGVGAALLGSIAELVVKESHHPVVLVGPSVRVDDSPWVGRPLVYGFDGSDASASLEPLVQEWAPALGLPARVVTVLHRDGEFIGNVDAGPAKRLAATLTDRLAAAVPDTRLEFLDGLDPARTIAAYAENERAALVAVATHGSGLAHALMGSVATRVARHAGCPVVVLRPRPHA